LTQSSVVFTSENDSSAAGREIGTRLHDSLGGQRPDAVILFASSRHDYGSMLRAIKETCSPSVLVGCSSAGEFVSNQRGEGGASAVGLRSADIHFAAGIGRGLRENRRRAAEEIVSSFHGAQTHQYPHRAALILADALAGYTDDFIEQLSVVTLGNYQFFGGGAGDDAHFSRT
jgi:hypothetical protein